MHGSIVEEWIVVLRSEVRQHRIKLASAFAVLCIAVVIAGLFLPKRFESSAVIHADDQNILQPLLEGSAEVTRIAKDPVAAANERVMSNRILEEVILRAGLAKSIDDKYAIDPIVKKLRSEIKVKYAGANYISITYQDRNPMRAYQVVSALVSLFISDSDETKKRESREAYLFIDNQVDIYKKQLQDAEDKLKDFKSKYNEGTEQAVDQRLNDLRSSTESLTLELKVARAKRDELNRQLSGEKQFVSKAFSSDVFRQRLAEAESKLATLRLSYNDTYPDIVALKQQISDLQQAVSDSENKQQRDTDKSTLNPAYGQMKADLAQAEVSVSALETRLAATNKLLEQENERSGRVGEYQAQLTELTRDYDVTRKIYQNLLERKEKARMSVALDVEGQGVRYQIKEPPAIPTSPKGLRSLHFFILAPLLGVILPLGALAAYVHLDPRIRFLAKFNSALSSDVQLLGIIPHYYTTVDRNLEWGEWMRAVVICVAALVVYLALVIVKILGIF